MSPPDASPYTLDEGVAKLAEGAVVEEEEGEGGGEGEQLQLW